MYRKPSHSTNSAAAPMTAYGHHVLSHNWKVSSCASNTICENRVVANMSHVSLHLRLAHDESGRCHCWLAQQCEFWFLLTVSPSEAAFQLPTSGFQQQGCLARRTAGRASSGTHEEATLSSRQP